MLEFFPQDLVLFLKRDVLLVWHFALPHVIFLFVCLCCLEILNTLCFTIIRLELALLLAWIKLFSSFFSRWNALSGFDFLSAQTAVVGRIGAATNSYFHYQILFYSFIVSVIKCKKNVDPSVFHTVQSDVSDFLFCPINTLHLLSYMTKQQMFDHLAWGTTETIF